MKDLRRRLERLEAELADKPTDGLADITEREWAALACLRHVVRVDVPGTVGTPITDAEWEQLERAGLVP